MRLQKLQEEAFALVMVGRFILLFYIYAVVYGWRKGHNYFSSLFFFFPCLNTEQYMHVTPFNVLFYNESHSFWYTQSYINVSKYNCPTSSYEF